MKDCSPHCIFIDWHGTLSHSLFWEQLQDKNHLYAPYSPLIQRWLAQNKDIIKHWMRGHYSSEEISVLIGKSVNIDPEIIMGELKESCEKMRFCSDEIPKLVYRIRSNTISN